MTRVYECTHTIGNKNSIYYYIFILISFSCFIHARFSAAKTFSRAAIENVVNAEYNFYGLRYIFLVKPMPRKRFSVRVMTLSARRMYIINIIIMYRNSKSSIIRFFDIIILYDIKFFKKVFAAWSA